MEGENRTNAVRKWNAGQFLLLKNTPTGNIPLFLHNFQIGHAGSDRTPMFDLTADQDQTEIPNPLPSSP